eukprot:jgi/Botrbrau1/18331/Bobra.0179s0058.1
MKRGLNMSGDGQKDECQGLAHRSDGRGHDQSCQRTCVRRFPSASDFPADDEFDARLNSMFSESGCILSDEADKSAANAQTFGAMLRSPEDPTTCGMQLPIGVVMNARTPSSPESLATAFALPSTSAFDPAGIGPRRSSNSPGSVPSCAPGSLPMFSGEGTEMRLQRVSPPAQKRVCTGLLKREPTVTAWSPTDLIVQPITQLKPLQIPQPTTARHPESLTAPELVIQHQHRRIAELSREVEALKQEKFQAIDRLDQAQKDIRNLEKKNDMVRWDLDRVKGSPRSSCNHLGSQLVETYLDMRLTLDWPINLKSPITLKQAIKLPLVEFLELYEAYINTGNQYLQSHTKSPALENLGWDMLLLVLGQCANSFTNLNSLLVANFNREEAPMDMESFAVLWSNVALQLRLTREQQERAVGLLRDFQANWSVVLNKRLVAAEDLAMCVRGQLGQGASVHRLATQYLHLHKSLETGQATMVAQHALIVKFMMKFMEGLTKMQQILIFVQSYPFVPDCLQIASMVAAQMKGLEQRQLLFQQPCRRNQPVGSTWRMNM